LPIYDRPMIHWCIERWSTPKITEIRVVKGGTPRREFLRFVGQGYEFGIDR